MEKIVFITYIISVIAFAMALWAVLEVKEIKKNEKRKIIQKRIEQIAKPIVTRRAHWG